MARTSRTTADAASAAGLEAARAAVEQPTPAKGAGSGDPLIGDLRRAGLLPLLVLHFASQEPAYGNQLIERIEALAGAAATRSSRRTPSASRPTPRWWSRPTRSRSTAATGS